MPDHVARIRELAVAGHRGDVGTARGGLDDTDGRVRAAALAALSRAGGLTAADLRTAVTDEDPVVRRRAAEVATTVAPRLGDEASIADLLDDPDPTVVEVAAWACGELVEVAGPEVVERLAALVSDHDDPLVREAAVAALGSIGDPRGLAAILTATGDKPAVRRRAVLALAPFDGPEVDAALARALDDRDWQVRQAAELLAQPEH